jgi:zinc transport system ATP-binding protein
METIVSLEHVYFGYRDEPVLKDLNFEVKSGEFTGIIGPNGGGKTTLLKLILGFLKPQAGKIQVFGGKPQTALSQLAYVPQGMRFDRQFPISVIELVLSGRLSKLPWYGIFSKKDYRQTYEALEKVGMLAFKNESFGNLSGGQAQRALIARALVSEPNLLILDEPTASVDTQAGADIYNILQEQRKHMTILMVTHDLRTAIDLVDRVLIVQGGAQVIMPEKVCEHYAIGLYHTPLEFETEKRK